MACRIYLPLKSICVFSLFYLFSFSAIAQANKIDSTEMVTLRIDPQNARGAAVSQLFSEVKFIPLETTKESLFGRVNSLKIVNGQFLIYDYDTKAVLIFAADGKFKAKIDASRIPKEDGDKSKTEFYGYQLAEEGNTTFIVIYSSKYFFYFDLTGKLAKKVLQKDSKLAQEYKLADKQTTVQQNLLQAKGKDSTYYEVAILRKSKDTLRYFPFSMKRYQTDQYMSGSTFFDSGIANELFYVAPYDYNIYKVTPANLSLAYRMIFPANNSLPKDFMSNPVYVKKRFDYFLANQKIFYGIKNTYQMGNYLYFQMSSLGSNRDNKRALVYNLKTTELTSLQDLEPDAMSSFLPVTDAGAYYDFSNYGFHLFKDGYLYTSYSSLAMFTFKEQAGAKVTKLSPELEAYFKTQDRKSNPVIIQLKPKN